MGIQAPVLLPRNETSLFKTFGALKGILGPPGPRSGPPGPGTMNRLTPPLRGPERRDFALTLRFYSPEAYDYLRDDTKVPLPHPRTLSRWLQSVDGSPGFNMAVMNMLKTKAQEDASNYKWCHLMMDAMAIKQQVDYDPHRKKMVGFVEPVGDTADEAKEAIVFMVVGLRGSCKMPLGYFFHKNTHCCCSEGVNIDCIATFA